MKDPHERVRVALTLPGLLTEPIAIRSAEFAYEFTSLYILELICFDLRCRRTHCITGPIARRSAEAQEAVDRLIVSRYVPGRTEKDGALVQFMLGMATEVSLSKAPKGQFNAQPYRVRIPDMIWQCVKIRRRELRYATYSAYVTGLVRFDLMIGGPHKYFSGQDKDPEYLKELDRRTVAEFHAKKLRKTWTDYQVEKLHGRTLSLEERNQELWRITKGFIEGATAPAIQKQ